MRQRAPNRPKSHWRASRRAQTLYDQQIASAGITQEQFGRSSEIGSQSMVASLLNGSKPLSIDAATKLARALRCSIDDICPEMADYLKTEVAPVLGKVLRRAACVLLAPLLLQFAPSDALAKTIQHNAFYGQFTVGMHIAHLLRRIIAFLGLRTLITA